MAEPSAASSDRSPRALRLVGRVLGVLLVVSALVVTAVVWRLTDVYPRTDDAAVRANIVGIAPHVSGPIVELHVVDNQHVRAGDLLFVIDARPYEARLERARAELALTRKEVEAGERAVAAAAAEIGRREAALAAADAQVTQRETEPGAADAEIARRQAERLAAEAAVARLDADLAYAEDYLHRVEPLLTRQYVTADRVSEARSKRDAAAAARREGVRKLAAAEAAIAEAMKRKQAAVAGVAHAHADRAVAAAGIDQAQQDRSKAQALLAQYTDSNARIAAAQAAVQGALLDVGYCRVTAPFDAYVTNLNIAAGEYARQGQQIFALVDDRAWYVIANFRETYMSTIKPGMTAEVYLMSYPGRRFRGVVQGIGWATHPEEGATVGVLPLVSRTLNWVRLANRFPVRILLEERDPERPFRMGSTAVVTIKGFPSVPASPTPSR
ncbi:MAG TPA: biotin/lipoyl-binding protein [Candidatus Methylomirabilis sp.]|nr:biotin/lipoyl-binding protein [Candidatus Methylomirabilis sp.]